MSMIVETEIEVLKKRQIINLSAPNVNAYFILGITVKIGQKLGFSANKIAEIKKEMNIGDYEHIVQVFIKEFSRYIKVIR
jgi:hypothetical protein